MFRYVAANSFLFGATLITPWLLSVLIAATKTSGELGQFTLAWSIATPLFAFFAMQTSIPYLNPINGISAQTLLKTRRLACLFAAVVFLAVSLWKQSYPMSLFGIILLFKIVEMQTDASNSIYRKNDHLFFATKVNAVKFGLFCAAVGLALFRKQHTDVILFTTSFALLAITVLEGLWTKDVATTSEKGMKDLLILSWPLGFAALLNTLGTNLPRIILEHFQGADALGQISKFNIFTTLVYIIPTAAFFIAYPHLSKTGKIQLRSILKVQFLTTLLSVISILGIYFISGYLSFLAVPEDLKGPFIILLTTCMVNSLIFTGSVILAQTNSYRRQMMTQVICVIFVVFYYNIFNSTLWQFALGELSRTFLQLFLLLGFSAQHILRSLVVTKTHANGDSK